MIMDLELQTLIESIDKCSLHISADDYDKFDLNQVLSKWQNNLIKFFPDVSRLISGLNIKKLDRTSSYSAFSAVYILYQELLNDGELKSEYSKKCAVKLNDQFKLMYNVPINKLLHDNNVCDKQEMFDTTMEALHLKMTPKDFRTYPVLIYVYFMIVKEIKNLRVNLQANKILPISLLLIHDYVDYNKKIGLDCCLIILDCLTEDHFENGNYYEVVYDVLKKSLSENDLELNNKALKCLLRLIEILPKQVKISVVDDTLDVLEHMHTESNLYRKQAYFKFLNKVIPIHGIHCAKKKMFLTLICDNLDICSNESVRELLLSEVVECLENWVRYCWCIWKLTPNKKLLSVLIKILYITHDDYVMSCKIQAIFVTLCKLSTDEEQIILLKSLEKSIDNMKSYNAEFAQKLFAIKNQLSV